ncbi:hypothetical protein [Halomarina litorea]|uniref:hypothetical protein n=1 Tax=Halomarina litorea TaxID=2961595 RepID=UPI0020C1EC50|nr:hypothetical protein [Halomarina sp. BCD28]
MNAQWGPLDRLRRPEYTGANRCLPCTVVNVALAVGLSLVVALVSPEAALAVLVASLAGIWLRGYLVPGTPELTKRYLPRRVLAWFGKVPVAVRATPDFDPETALSGMGVIEDDPETEDVRLVPAFAAALDEATPSPDAVDRRSLAAALGAPDAAFEDYGEAVVSRARARDAGEGTAADGDGVESDGEGESGDDDSIAQWESRAALAADAGAARTLPGWDESWARRPPAERALLCRSVRTLLPTCPACDGLLAPSASTVESCCSRYEVLALSCTACEARLFETAVA